MGDEADAMWHSEMIEEGREFATEKEKQIREEYRRIHQEQLRRRLMMEPRP